MPLDPLNNAEWVADCMKWRRRVLTGLYSHWCYGWDGLPIDVTCDEWPCECAEDLKKEQQAINEARWKGVVPIPEDSE